jgi:hypothetical protein
VIKFAPSISDGFEGQSASYAPSYWQGLIVGSFCI